MGMSRFATRKLLVALAGGALLAGVSASAASAQLPSTTDPRVGLSAGYDNAAIAKRGIERLAHREKPAGFFNPANPGDAVGPCVVNCINDKEVYSFHTGGANVCMADGSVRFLKASTPIDVVLQLLTRARCEVISNDPF